LSYLIDTNVLSEIRRKTPDANVVKWVNSRPPTSLYLSVLTLGELRKGIDSLADSKRRLKLVDWLETELPLFFAGRILAIDEGVADEWGKLLAKAGRTVAAIDSLLGATASHHGLTMVTRNSKDFENLGLDVLNPWND
jgi:predicted nucleic acid-binding protein